MLEQIDDHFGQGLVALVPPFWGKPRIASLLLSYLRQVQLLEDRAWEVLQAFDVNTADAARLAVLGRVVGQSNFGWSLETYRAVIRAKIATNRSHGTEDDIANVIFLITGVGGASILAVGHAHLLVSLVGGVDADAIAALVFLLPKARPAGVQLQLLVSGSAEPDEIFLWGDTWSTDEFWAGAIVL